MLPFTCFPFFLSFLFFLALYETYTAQQTSYFPSFALCVDGEEIFYDAKIFEIQCEKKKIFMFVRKNEDSMCLHYKLPHSILPNGIKKNLS